MADDDIRALYEDRPYPAPGATPRRNPLSSSWLRGAVHPGQAPLREGARILVAGCGTGVESEQLARSVPGLVVVGVDASVTAIERARSRVSKVRYEVMDLTDSAAVASLGPFDFISCHAVADYVRDSPAVLHGLAAALAPDGVLLLAVNTNHHPMRRVQRLFDALDVSGRPFDDEPVQRGLLGLCAAWLGAVPGMGDLSQLPADVVALDLFPPFAHHRAPVEWVRLAHEAGLHAVGVRRAAAAVLSAGDAAHYLLGNDRVSIGLLAHEVSPSPAAWLLFSPRAPTEPDWTGDLRGWVTTADPSVPVEQIPAATEDWDSARSLTIFLEQRQQVVPLTVRGLEILRRSIGTRTLGELAADCGWEPARLDLFRLFHADLLHFARR